MVEVPQGSVGCLEILELQQLGRSLVLAAASLCSVLGRIAFEVVVSFPRQEVGRDRPGWRRRNMSAVGCSEVTTLSASEDVHHLSDGVGCGEEEFWWCGAQWWSEVKRTWSGLASPQMWSKGFGIWRWGRGGARIDELAGHWRGGAGRGRSDVGRHLLEVLSTQRKETLWWPGKRTGWDSDGLASLTQLCCRNGYLACETILARTWLGCSGSWRQLSWVGSALERSRNESRNE